MKHLLLAVLLVSVAAACQNKDKSKDDKTANAAKAAKAKTTTNPAKTTPNPAAKPAAPSSSPGPNQWWCYQMEDLGECHTSLAMCQAKRRAEAKVLIKRKMNPIALGACKPQPDAYCFTFNKAEYKAPKAKCNRDSKSCTAMYNIYKSQWPDLAMTACEKGGGWQSGAKPATAPAPTK